MSERKTLYHGDLRQPTTLTIKTDALRSRYKKDENESGAYYVFVMLNGVERSYFGENKASAEFLGKFKDQTITVKAEGSKEDAYFTMIADSPTAPEQTTTANPAPTATDVVKTVHTAPEAAKGPDGMNAYLTKIMNGFYMIEKQLAEEVEQARMSGVDDSLLTSENFGGKAGTAFRLLDNAGFIDQLPSVPMWSVTNNE